MSMIYENILEIEIEIETDWKYINDAMELRNFLGSKPKNNEWKCDNMGVIHYGIRELNIFFNIISLGLTPA